VSHLTIVDTPPPAIELMHDSYEEPGGVTITITGVSFGPDYSRRLIVVGCRYTCSTDSNHNITATIGGVSATRIVNRAATNTGACMFTAQPSGTSGTISIRLTDAASLSGAVGVWAVNFIRSVTPVDTGSDIANNPLNLNLTTSAQGVGCAISGISGSTPQTTSWSGATKDFDIQNGGGGGSYSGGSFSRASSGTRTISADPTGSGSIAGCSASFR